MTSADPRNEPATYRKVLANRRFRLLFGTRTLTVAADSLRIMTLSMVVFSATGSPLLSALAFGVGFLPQLAGSFFLGSVADRARPRRLIVAGCLLSCAAAVAMAAVPMPVTVMLLLIAAVAGLSPVFSGATNRLVAETLAGDAYVLGRALFNMASSGAQLLGVAAGGFAVALLGPRTTLLLSAAAYLAAAVAVRLRLPDVPAPEQPAIRGRRQGSVAVLRQSWTGSMGLLADRQIRGLLLAQWLPPMFVTGAESLVVPFAGDHFDSDGVAGLLLASLPAGMLIGDAAVGRLVRPDVRERLVPVLLITLGLPLTGFGLGPPWALCAVLLVITGTGFSYALGLQRAFRDAVPEERRGQAFGLLSAGLMSVQGVGPSVLGAVAEFTGTGTAIALAGLATAASAGGMVTRRR